MLRFRRSADVQERSKLAAIQDPAACKTWLAGLVPIDGIDNLRHIGELLGELMESNVAATRKFEIVERVRASLFPALRERVRDHAARGVPLSPAEYEPIWALLDTLEDVRESYELLLPRLDDSTGITSMVLENVRDAPGALAPTKVVALHRALDLNAHVIALYLRLRVAVPDRLWNEHCRMGQLSRQLNCQDEAVDDPLNASVTETCREAFNVPLLLALADPNSLGQLEFQAAYACCSRWASKTGYRIDSASELGGAPAKPSLNPGPVVQLASGQHQVRLDTQRVIKSIERRLALLEEGNSPQSIGLGEGITSQASRGLLRALLRRWGHIMPDAIEFPEQNWRAPHAEFALAVVNVTQSPEIAQRQSNVSGNDPTYDYVRQRDDALTRSPEEIERERLERLLDGAETWSMVGEMPDGALCARRHSRPRLSLGQLVGLKPGGKSGPTPLLLGTVLGLQQSINDGEEGAVRPAANHLVRVRLLPGLPRFVKASIDQVELDWVYMLVPNAPLPDETPIWDAVRDAPQSYALVLPLATYRAARTVRVVAHGLATAVRLEELLQRGLDYDLVRFKPV